MRIARITGFFALLFLLSCDVFHKEPAPCPELAGLYFTPLNANVSSRKISSCCNDEVNAFDRLYFSEYLLQLKFDASYHASVEAPSLLFQSAYAGNCLVNGQNGSRVSIQEIELITLYDIDEQHKKGSPVSDLFNFEEMGSSLPLSHYLSGDDRRIRSEISHLRLNQQPGLSDTCAFKISVILDNGHKYTSISAPVIFN